MSLNVSQKQQNRSIKDGKIAFGRGRRRITEIKEFSEESGGKGCHKLQSKDNQRYEPKENKKYAVTGSLLGLFHNFMDSMRYKLARRIQQ